MKAVGKLVRMTSDNCCLSLSGCGFLGVYHLGAVDCLRKNGSGLMSKVTRFAGASAGSLVAATLIVCPEKLTDSLGIMYALADEVQTLKFGALTPQFSIIERCRTLIESVLPPNAHELADGRLHVSLTRVSDKTNHIISKFPTQESLVQALLASCYIPIYAGKGEEYPMLNGEAYIDGGFSNNLPKFTDIRTITISPFSGDADISPRDLALFDWTMSLGAQLMKVNMLNVLRGAQALFPPKRSTLEEYYRLGFMNAMQFLLQNDLLDRAEGSEV